MQNTLSVRFGEVKDFLIIAVLTPGTESDGDFGKKPCIYRDLESYMRGSRQYFSSIQHPKAGIFAMKRWMLK
jgi:hypothetical protein